MFQLVKYLMELNQEENELRRLEKGIKHKEERKMLGAMASRKAEEKNA